jgi:uncharacterized protein
MVRRGRGAVISVSSVAAFGQNPGSVSYCATKAWINSFTEGLDMELRELKSPVKVQALCPGYTISEFHDALGSDKGPGTDRETIPAFLWLRADELVEASLRGLERGTVVVVPDWKYKIAAAFMKHSPYALKKRVGRPGRRRH